MSPMRRLITQHMSHASYYNSGTRSVVAEIFSSFKTNSLELFNHSNSSQVLYWPKIHQFRYENHLLTVTARQINTTYLSVNCVITEVGVIQAAEKQYIFLFHQCLRYPKCVAGCWRHSGNWIFHCTSQSRFDLSLNLWLKIRATSSTHSMNVWIFFSSRSTLKDGKKKTIEM